MESIEFREEGGGGEQRTEQLLEMRESELVCDLNEGVKEGRLELGTRVETIQLVGHFDEVWESDGLIGWEEKGEMREIE
jgi:hypothetical protein